MSQGSIYPALIRLEQQGWIQTQWGVSETNRQVKILFAHQGGRAAAAGRSRELGAGDGAGRAVPRGEVMMPRPFARLLALVAARRLDRELDGEVLAHLELAERDAHGRRAVAGGGAARRRAAVSGASNQMKEDASRSSAASAGSRRSCRDVRYGLLAAAPRSRASPSIAIGVMAIGIGANAAMFSLVDARAA